MSDAEIQSSTPDSAPAPAAQPPEASYPPGVRVPRAVREQRRRADELQAQLVAAVAADEAAQAEQAEPSPQSIVPVQEPEPPAPQPPPPQDNYEQRYRTLQGKYDAEIPQLRNQVHQLEQLIAAMQAAPRQPEPAPAPPVQEPEEAIPEEDYTTYGPDFVDSTRRWARAELAPVVKDLRNQVAELRQQAQQSTGDRVKDRVRQQLDRDPDLAGRWEALDHDQGFHNWLQEVDEFSGARRHDLLRHHYNNGDALRTAAFFKAYLREHTDYQREPPAPPPQTPVYQNGNGAGNVDLAAYAAPGRAARATPGPGAPERRIWTTSEIQAFYAGRVRGRFKGREAEADRLERDILTAANEGRVRND